MMNRQQRIDYEILDCAINGAWGNNDYATTVPAFLKRLLALFPDCVAPEFTDACKRLSKEGVVSLRQLDRSGLHAYRDLHDDASFFGTKADGFCLTAIAGSEKFFHQLSTLIDVPAAARQKIGSGKAHLLHVT
jgi:hypothetical protein